MKILITGATGLVGAALTKRLLARGDNVTATSRNAAKAKAALGHEVKILESDALSLAGFDAVVHLAGESIAGGRWTEDQKKRIYDSRVLSSKTLVSAIDQLDAEAAPKVFVAASAIGIYGDRGEEILTESSRVGAGFLSDVCKDWEAATIGMHLAHTRQVALRIGLVLAANGGALVKMLPVFKAGLGGKLGAGDQWMSWIHIDDLVEVIMYCIDNPKLAGPINAVAPESVTNAQFTKTLARTLHRWAVLPVPSLALKLALGEMSELLLASQNVSPTKLIEAGYVFQYPNLAAALAQTVR